MNGYPDDWKEIATTIKDAAGWKCERCGKPHEPPAGYCLTVHHLDGDKSQCAAWNLAALCQRCHLSVQGRVKFQQDYLFEHTPWMKRHVEAYNVWAACNGKPLLTCV